MRQDPTNTAIFYTSQYIARGSTFYLSVIFSGQYLNWCKLSFKIKEENTMYKIQFLVGPRRKDSEVIESTFKLVAETFQTHSTSFDDLDLIQGKNDIKIMVGEEYITCWVNGMKMKEFAAVNPTRLSRYRYLVADQTGPCVKLDLEESYIRHLKGSYESVPSIVREIALNKGSFLRI
jgi:hypothetical protein